MPTTSRHKHHVTDYGATKTKRKERERRTRTSKTLVSRLEKLERKKKEKERLYCFIKAVMVRCGGCLFSTSLLYPSNARIQLENESRKTCNPIEFVIFKKMMKND